MDELRVPLLITELEDGTSIVQFDTPYTYLLSSLNPTKFRDVKAYTNDAKEIAWLLNHLKEQLKEKK